MMRKQLMCAMAIAACGVIAAGCGPKKEETVAPPSMRGPAVIQEPAAVTPPGDSMAARVNGTVITHAEVDRALGEILQLVGGRISPEQMAGMRPTLRRQALETLISQQLILDEADREKIQPDAKDVDAKMKEIAGRFPDAEAFKKMLAAAGLSEKQLRGDVLRNLKIEALLEKKLPKTEAVSEQEVEAFYRDNPEEFKAPERVRASHILITFKPEDDQKERARKRATLEGLKGKIGKGADFAKLAAENSDCPSKSQGGDLGFFGRGQMVKPFEDAAFAMKVNQVSDIVESEFGYHLIKVTGREEAGVVPLKDVRDKLASFLTRQKKQKAVGEHLQKLRSNAKVEYAKGAQS